MSYAICEQQRCRSACAFAQSDQHLCCLLPRLYNMYTCSVQSFKILASFCSWEGWFEFYLVENPWRHIFAWCGSYMFFVVIVPLLRITSVAKWLADSGSNPTGDNIFPYLKSFLSASFLYSQSSTSIYLEKDVKLNHLTIFDNQLMTG